MAAILELGNQQFEVADAVFPASFPVAVALVGSLGTARRQLDLRDPSR